MKDDYSEIIVNRILSLCKQRDISIYQLSIMSGNPKIKTLHKIALAFGFTLAELVDFPELNDFSFEDEGDS